MTRPIRPAAADVVDLLRARGATLATAESVTGGRLAALVTDVPGSSAVYLGGVVSYATRFKVDVLGVPTAIVEQYGVVSGECARAMAHGALRLTGASYAVSTTGVAGPERQEGKPVGTVYVALVGAEGSELIIGMELNGDRSAIQDRTCHEALAAIAGNV